MLPEEALKLKIHQSSSLHPLFVQETLGNKGILPESHILNHGFNQFWLRSRDQSSASPVLLKITHDCNSSPSGSKWIRLVIQQRRSSPASGGSVVARRDPEVKSLLQTDLRQREGESFIWSYAQCSLMGDLDSSLVSSWG